MAGRNYGCTRMIVFPLRRVVGLRAATSSSRSAMSLMLFLRRPSRTRWTISVSRARSASTTKSIARPSAGRASWPDHGHQCPPGPIRPAGRAWNWPPMTSNTRSIPPASSNASWSRSRNPRAPNSTAFRRSAARPVDDAGAGLTRELGHHRSDRAARTVRQDARPAAIGRAETVPARRSNRRSAGSQPR